MFTPLTYTRIYVNIYTCIYDSEHRKRETMSNSTMTLPKSLSIFAAPVVTPGEMADEAARARVFERYNQGQASNTRRRQLAALNLFADHLCSMGLDVTGQTLASDPSAWRGISWGLVEGWLDWMLAQGYAVGTVNVRLSTIKTYAKQALRAGVLSGEQFALIASVGGFSFKQSRHLDEQRRKAGQPTRKGHKKAEAVSLTPGQAAALKNQPDTPQGRRDRLMMCLLLDHGLRCGEVAGLRVTDFDLQSGELRFFRPKVAKVQTHILTTDTLRAARVYFASDAPAVGPVLRASRRGGRLHSAGMSEQSITARVRDLGQALGIDGLSAHDCRHFWATSAARHGTPIDRLQDAGGWSSPAMPLRYVEKARIANEGVRL